MNALWCYEVLYRVESVREADKGKNKGKKTGQIEITPGGGMTEICGFMKGSFRLRLLFILRDTAGKRACLHAHLPANAKSIRRGSFLIDYRRYGGSVGATVEIICAGHRWYALLYFKRAFREMILVSLWDT